MSGYLQKLEGYPELESGIIRQTKINKVLKAMIKLPSIPGDGEFNFKQRSQDLLAKWNTILSSDTVDGGKEAENEEDKETKDLAKDEVKPDSKEEEIKDEETNGVKEAKPSDTTDKDEETANADAAEETAAKDDTPAALKTKIGTGVEGEKEAPSTGEDPVKPSEDIEMKSDEPATAEEPNVEEKPADGYKAPAETAEATA
jgi:hypothetical protein